MNATHGFAITLAAMLSASGAAAQAAPREDAKPATQSQKSKGAAAKPQTGQFASGMTVTKDPVTGELRQATPEELQTLNNQTQARSRAAPASRLNFQAIPNGGGVGVMLDQSFDSQMEMTRLPDGSLGVVCYTDHAAEAGAKTAGDKAASKAKKGARHVH